MKKSLTVEQTAKNVQKPKQKKNANDQVNLELEFKKDPKFKTEMCKSWGTKGYCVYGNKCRFAHGRHELFDKSSTNNKYKQKECLSFYQHGFCLYGPRCHFKHNEKSFTDINRSYYFYLLETHNLNENQHNLNWNGFGKEMWGLDSPDLNLIKSGNYMNGCQFSSGTLSTNSNDSSIIVLGGRSYGKRLGVFTDITNKKSSSKTLDESFDCSNVTTSIFNCQSSISAI
jgi:hypothetical protein